MKICVYGAGAIGGTMAVHLKQGGADVCVIARGAHLNAIRANGLKLLTGLGESVARMPAAEDPQAFGPQDYVIVAMKAHQAWQAASRMRPLLGPETAVVTAQNGIPWWYFYRLEGRYENLQLNSVDPGGRQWKAIGPERAIGCTIYPAAEIVAPGVIEHTFGNSFALGEPACGETGKAEKLARALRAGGFEAEVYPDIRQEIWLKLWGNLCFNPISALTRATLETIATDPGTRAVARAMMLEAAEIASRIGVKLTDVEARIDLAASVGHHRTSMLQDLEKGRLIELDAILTVVQEIGRAVGAPSPAIGIVLALTQQMARMAGVYPAIAQAAMD